MEWMVHNSIDKGLSSPGAPERPQQVSQPLRTQVPMEAMQSILAEVNDIVRDSAPSKAGEQWSGSGTQQVATTGGAAQAAQTASWRDQAIAAIPAPVIMQKQLAVHIEQEIKDLRKQASKITDLRKPGAAHRFNELQSKIHRLNNVLTAIFEASMDVLKRLFIKVFIDKQPIS